MNTQNETKSSGESPERILHYEEKKAASGNGMLMLILILILFAAGLAGFILGISGIESSTSASTSASASILLTVAGGICLFLLAPILCGGLKIVKPNEALVLTLFGRYYGTLRREGFYFVNPFVEAINPGSFDLMTAAATTAEPAPTGKTAVAAGKKINKKISLKSMTLNNEKQKVNDELGNPIIIGIVVIWRVVNTAKAVFNVDNYVEYLSIQCDSSLRNIVRLYPYDASAEEGEKSLRGSSQDVAERLKAEIQSRVDIAGLEITEARITHLAYAPEIASAMLQRQQASAIIAARQLIVEGAVGMVQMALTKLSDNNIVELDDERKAAMVSNLLVVLCGNKDAQPIVNSGSIY